MSKGTGIYKYVNGQRVELTQTQVKNEIKEFYGWTDAEYKRQYNRFRNSYINYKTFTGGEIKSVSNLLYREVKSKKTYDRYYKPSREMQAIREFSSASTQSFTKRTKKSDIKRLKKYHDKVYTQFEQFINKNTGAMKIYDKLKDNPIQLEKALSDYADKLHTEIDEQTKEIKGQAIPFSDQNYYSDAEIDFDIENYLN